MATDYRMNLIWTSHGEQLRADLERNVGLLSQTRGEMGKNQQQMGAWGQQMRAFATTVRYAFAGAVVYSLATAVSSLGDFEDKLGQIDALAATLDRSGNLRGLGDQLDVVAKSALETSNTLGIAVGDVEDFMARFYSSFQPPAGAAGVDQMKGFVKEVANLQVALGGEVGDPQALAGGVSGFIQGMGPAAIKDPGKSAARLSDIIASVIKRSPTIVGTDITRDIGRLGAAQTAMNMTPEQIFAVYGAASLRGGSGAVIGRGVSQLLTSSLLKPGKQQLQAFGQAGLPTDPNALRAMGGWNILMQLMQRVQSGPVSFQNPAVLRTDSGMSDQEAINAAGVKGINVTLASHLFGRVESLRQFLNLLSVGGPKALNDFIDSFHQAERDHLAKQMADTRNQQRQLQLAANAQKNLNLSIVRGFDPVLHTLAGGIRGVSGAAVAHPDATQAVILGAAGAQLASRIVFGTGLLGLGGRGLSRLPGIGRLMERNPMMRQMFGRTVGRGGELAAASVVGSGLGAFASTGKGTRGDPIWTVIDPLSWFMPGAPSGGATTGDPSSTNTGKFGRFFKKVPIVPIGLGAAALGAADVGAILASAGDAPTKGYPGKRYPLLDKLMHSQNIRGGDPGFAIGAAFLRHQISASQAESRLANIRLEGTADLTIGFEVTDEMRKITKSLDKVFHVPVKLWPAASGGGRPQHRGKNKSMRGQGTR